MTYYSRVMGVNICSKLVNNKHVTKELQKNKNDLLVLFRAIKAVSFLICTSNTGCTKQN